MKGSVDPPRFNPSHREGYPNIRTVDYWLGGDKSERYPQSRYALDFWNIGALFFLKKKSIRVCNNHNKADGFERRLEVSSYVKASFPKIRIEKFSFILWRTSSMPLIWRGRCCLSHA